MAPACSCVRSGSSLALAICLARGFGSERLLHGLKSCVVFCCILESDAEPVGEEARPITSLVRRSPNDQDFVILVEMVGAGLGHPRIVYRLLDLQIGTISRMVDVNDGHVDLRVMTEIHQLALFVDGLPPHDERSSHAVCLDTEELVDDGHHLTPLSAG